MEMDKKEPLVFDDYINSKKEHLLSLTKYKHKPIPASLSFKTYSEKCIIADYADLVENPIENIHAVPQDIDNALYCWNVFVLLEWPKDRGMKREIYEVQLHFPTSYPIKPPTVYFISSIPSSICLNIHPENDFKIYVDNHNSFVCDSTAAIRTKFDLRKYLNTVFQIAPKTSIGCSSNAYEKSTNFVFGETLRKRPASDYIPGPNRLDCKRAGPKQKPTLDVTSETEEVNVALVQYALSNLNPTPTDIPYVSQPGFVSLARKRLLRDLKEIENDAPSGITAKPYDNDIFIWDVSLPTPNDNVIEATLYFEHNYPFSSPKMYFKTRVFHPNVTGDGRVCLKDIEMAWTPAQTILSFIISVQYLLSDPNPIDPVNLIAADMLKRNPELYHKRALECFKNVEIPETYKNAIIEKYKDYIIDSDTSVDLEEELYVQRALEEMYKEESKL